jgi:large repetitive protein
MTGQAVRIRSNQPPPLMAAAGKDSVVVRGQPVMIGAGPTACDGYSPYLYSWSPAAGLDDPTSPNPVARPEKTTTYLLTVTDLKNCMAQDEVTVTVDQSWTEVPETNNHYKIYPNPVYGTLRISLLGSGPAVLKIINSTGRLVYEASLDFDSGIEKEIDTRLFAKGCYFTILIWKDMVLANPVLII